MDFKNLPQVGQTVYWISPDYYGEPPQLRIGIIYGLYVEENGQINILTDIINRFESNPKFRRYSKSAFWFSKKKAENVLAAKLKQRENQRIRLDKKRELLERLNKDLPTISNNYIGREVLIKVGRINGNTRRTEWIRAVIHNLYLHSRRSNYCFVESGNCYPLSKENKTWKFYTEKLKLEIKKQELENQLREIENQLKEKGHE